MAASGRTSLALASCLLILAPAARAAQAEGEERPVLGLSIEEAVRRALESNADIAVQRYEPLSAAEAAREAEGAYDPFLGTTLSTRSQKDPARNAFSGGEKVDTDTLTFNLGLSQNLKTGGVFWVDFNNNKVDTNNVFTAYNPAYNSTFNVSLRQPLLKDFKIDSSRQQLKVTKKSQEISDVQFHETVVNTVATVKQFYYDLLFAIDNLEAQKKNLALAKKLLEENQIRVRVGTMAPLDVVSAESEVASREEGVINAETTLADAEDALRRAIFPRNDASAWQYRIVPSERPSVERVPVDVERAVQRALEGRTDIVAARKSLESAEVTAQLARNQTLPNLSLVGGYGSSGIGGTQIVRDGLGGPVIETVPGGYGDAAGDALGGEYPTWVVGVNFSYPIRNRSAKANDARARIAVDQQRARIERLELQVITDVRSVARSVEANFKRVESTRAARVLQERRLDAEEKRFAAGMSTNFLVTQAQRDLALAEVNELRAAADYRKSQVNFERVQEAGGGANVALATTLSGVSRVSGSLTTGATTTSQ